MKSFRIHLIVFSIGFLLPLVAQAQERITGLSQNPLIAKEAIQARNLSSPKDNSSIKLPFIEDFSDYTGYPNGQLWLDRQGFVNNNFPIFPPSIGVVTLDALNEEGRVYAHAERDAFGADTLTSQPIRLDSNFTQHRAMRIGDSLYFSFYFQPGGGCKSNPAVEWERIGDAPESNDKLILEFGYATGNVVFTGFIYGEYILGPEEHYIAGDTMDNPFTGDIYIFESNAFPGETIYIPADSVFGPEYVWNEVWSSPGCNLDDWLAENPLQYFKQVLIPITDEQYLRNNFQFRFRNFASLDLDSWSSGNIIGWASNCDQWHIDYIRIDVDRSAQDLYPADVAFVSPTTSALRQYQAMPWKQYRTSDMAESFHNDLSNLSAQTKNTGYTYSVKKQDGGSVYTFPVNYENATPYSVGGLHTYTYHAEPTIGFVYPYDNADSASFLITHVFRMEGTNDERLQNDTCVFEQKFHNYYAYDDGTAEAGYTLLSTMSNPESSLAVQFTLAQPDTLQCVRMWFNRTLNDENVDYFTLMVWDDNEGQPGNAIYSLPAQLPEYAEDYLDFVNYYLEEPIALEGTFYVGFYQNHDVQLNIGFDQNNDARGHFFYKTANNWMESFLKGAPMIRPVLGKKYDHSGILSHPTASIQLYPNPTTGLVYIQSENNEPFSYQITDIYGRILQHDLLTNLPIDLSNYANGIYLIQILKQHQILQTEKIIKQ